MPKIMLMDFYADTTKTNIDTGYMITGLRKIVHNHQRTKVRASIAIPRANSPLGFVEVLNTLDDHPEINYHFEWQNDDPVEGRKYVNTDTFEDDSHNWKNYRRLRWYIVIPNDEDTVYLKIAHGSNIDFKD